MQALRRGALQGCIRMIRGFVSAGSVLRAIHYAMWLCSLFAWTHGATAGVELPRIQTGIASYYADKHHGRLTASGETFNMNGLSAAHRTLPFGTKVKVTSLANNRSVLVRINDRG